MNTSDFNGIILYDIELDGCLNGVYTNMGKPKGVIYNEIARKIKTSENVNEKTGVELDIPGVYDCQYFDKGNHGYQCILTIKPGVGNNDYSFEWKKGKENNFHW